MLQMRTSKNQKGLSETIKLLHNLFD